MTFRSFFAGDVQFVAPSFQRPYTWEQDSWEPILLSALDAGHKEHFLGAMVTMTIGTTAQGINKQLLIDGHHRLLTVLALVAAMRAASTGKDAEFARDLADLCLFNNAEGSSRMKFIVTRKDRSAFESILNIPPPDEPRRHPLCKAFRFFLTALQDISLERLQEAYKKVAHQFMIVAIMLDKDEDPYPVFKTFSAPEHPFTKTGLDAYNRFSPDPELMAMIAGGESQETEFKESALLRSSGTNDEARGSAQIARAVAGFLNSSEGGTLLLGVRDDGSIRGIQEEYAAIDRGKANWDGYQLFLHNLLRMRLSIENPFLLYSIEKRTLQGNDIALIRVRPAPAPVYLEKRLYVRSGNQTLEMQGPDLIHYVAMRWPDELSGST